MTKEIKFRAWDKKKMINWEELLKYYSDGGSDYDLHAIFSGDEHLELMQYTGLKDKNGKEIYEGDIVRCDENVANTFGIDVVSEVKYIMGSFYAGTTTFYLVNTNGVYRGEIIGNIYENPELLAV